MIMIEVVVSIAILIAGILGTLAILDAARGTAATAQRTSAADAVAQRALEAMRAMPYASLYDCSIPAASSDPHDARRWVTSGGTLLVQQDYRAGDGQLLTGVPAGGEPFWSGTCSASSGVDPGPIAFSSGAVRGTLYRYVTAEGTPCDSGLSADLGATLGLATGVDASAGTVGLQLTTSLAATAGARVSVFCQAGTTESKRLTVAVSLGGAEMGGPGPHRPIYLSTLVTNADAGLLSTEPDAGPLAF
jgi:type II secretory pathway pseudopilin PulG